MPSSRHQNLFASQIPVEPLARKSILPSFDDENDSPSIPPSAYTLDFDFSEFNIDLFPSPQLETFFTESYLVDHDKSKTKPVNSTNKTRMAGKVEHAPEVKLNSFAELEEDCSALQFDSEVIVLTRPRTPNVAQSLAGPSTFTARPAQQGQAVSLPRTKSGATRKESKYQRNAPPRLHLKGSNYDKRSSRRFSSRTRSSGGPQNEVISPAPTQMINSNPNTPNPNTPKSFRAFRVSYVSYASSRSSKRGSRIHFSTKELHRRRILKLQRTFGERIPLELVSVSPARRRKHTSRSSRPVSYRGPHGLVSPGGPIIPSVGDWMLDRIAPPPPKPKSSCGMFKVSNVVDSKDGRNTLRKSRALATRRLEEESFEIIEREEALEGEEGEGEEDQNRHNSIWLDEDSPLPQGGNQAQQHTSRLIPANEYYEGFTAIRSTQIFHDDDGDDELPNLPDLLPSRPVSDASFYTQHTSVLPSRTSSPSMPAFCHGSDSDHAHFQHQLRRLPQHQHHLHPMPTLNAHTQAAASPSPARTTTNTPTPMPMLSPALFWPRMPFNTPLVEIEHALSSSTATSDFPPGPYDMSLFEDVDAPGPQEVMSSARRSERRQGWSGEWNQPSIRDVIQKLRHI